MSKEKRVSRRAVKRRPRTRDDYTNEAFGQGDSFLPKGDLTINPKAGRIQLIRPRFSEAGFLLFRPWASLLPEDPDQFEPGRLSTAPNDFGGWYRRVECALYVGLPIQGCEQSTFILYNPWDTAAKDSNPYRIFYRACKAAHKAGSFGPGRAWDAEWNKWMMGEAGKGADISAPGGKCFIQGQIYCNGTDNYYAKREGSPLGGQEGDLLPVIQLSGAAGSFILSLLGIETEDAEEIDAEENPAKAFVLGDPVGRYEEESKRLRGGTLICIYNPKMWTPPTKDKLTKMLWSKDEIPRSDQDVWSWL